MRCKLKSSKQIQTSLRDEAGFGIKRLMDLILSGVGLVIISPLLVFISLLILIVDGGPVFFFQMRPGFRGRPFKIVKFKTMKSGSITSFSDEERLTRLGKFLRSFSLDELPEIWNVFVGEMSLVGPRPLLMEYLPRYSPVQGRRHEIRPGITGWAQVNGRNQLTWNQKFECDVWYVENQNLILDFKILLMTVVRIFKRDGISAKGFATMPEFKPANGPMEMSGAEISEKDIQEVVQVLRSGRLALGPKVSEFENKIANYIGVKHAVAVSSGTAALHLIVKSLGIGPGDEVLVPSFTFAASVNAILYEGATPVFVDIRSDNYNLDPADLQKKLTSRTKAVMTVDVFGHSVDWDPIEQFAKKNNLYIIDDSCEALGAEYRGQKVGSFGDAAAFAFYPNKQITTGEGGIIVTNRDDIVKLARSYRNQGRDEMGQWLEHVRIGYNYRMDEMSGALGASQMDRIDSILDKRSAIADQYSERLRNISGVKIPTVLPEVKMSWFVYVISIAKGYSADDVIRGLAERGVPARAYFSPIHSQVYLKQDPEAHLKLPVTESISGTTLALPFHANLKESEIDFVVQSLREVLGSLKKVTRFERQKGKLHEFRP